MGRVRYQHTPNGTYSQTTYDTMGRRTGIVRYAGVPGTSGVPTVMSSWAYDKRGRVTADYADASANRFYTYLASGPVSTVIQNPSTNSTADHNSVWSQFTYGDLGRPTERDDYHWTEDTSCS